MDQHLEQVFDLIEYGHYREARRILASKPSTSVRKEALRQLIDVETSDPQTASLITNGFSNRHLSGYDRVLFLFVLARAAYFASRVDEACAALREAIKIATSSNDRKLLVRGQARLTRTVLHRVGVEAALPELIQLRRFAHAAGDARGIAEFHCWVAEIEMRRGRYDVATRHLGVAAGIGADDDLITNALIRRLEANVALLAAEPHRALDSAREAVCIWQEIGAVYSQIASLSTQAQLSIMIGDFADAQAALERTLSLGCPLDSKLATLDSLMQIAVERRDVNAVTGYINQIDSLGEFAANNYHWLWHVTTRARWLITLGHAADADEIMRAHAVLVGQAVDHRLVAKFRLLQAETETLLKPPTEATEYFADAVATIPTVTLEDVVQIARIGAALSTNSADGFVRRAERVRTIALSRDRIVYPSLRDFAIRGGNIQPSSSRRAPSARDGSITASLRLR
jgi:tetratricopeptide (TPR) repeat protein